MKRKRSKSNSDDHILKKIKKLERKLRKRRRRLSSTSSTSSTSSDDMQFGETSAQIHDCMDDASDIDIQDDILTTDIPATVDGPVGGDNHDGTTDNIPCEEETPSLDPEILSLLGNDPTNEKLYGDNLHKDLATRWKHILTNGLPKESKSELLKLYLPPENCTNMKSPKLNLEIKAAMSELNYKKDVFSQSRQTQLSSCLTAIGKSITLLLSTNDSVSQQIIKPLGDAGRLLCDYHYRESLSRRFAIINTLNKQTKDTIKNTKIDEYLFGSELAEHLKSSKAISKSGNELRSSVSIPQSSYRQAPPRNTLNSKGTQRTAATDSRPRPPIRKAAMPRNRKQENPTHQKNRENTRTRTRRR